LARYQIAHLIDRIQKLSPTAPTKQEMQVGETPAYSHFLPARNSQRSVHICYVLFRKIRLALPLSSYVDRGYRAGNWSGDRLNCSLPSL